MSIRRAAKIYEVPESSVRRRMAGKTSKADTHHGQLNLTAAEEEAIIRYVIDLDSRGFSPRRCDVRDMADILMAKRGARHVGKCWTDRFIKRQPKLRTRFSRAYDYQRALQEDPHVLDAWFRLVANMRAKYVTPETSDGLPQPWVSQTPKTATEAISQSTLIKDRVTKHQGSSPTSILNSVDQLAKAAVAVGHQSTLLSSEIKVLREANEALSKRRRAKRTRLQDSGHLTGEEASQLLVEKGAVAQEGRDEGAGEGSSKRRKTSARHCGNCQKAGHNARTCTEAAAVDCPSDPEQQYFI